MKFWAEIHAWDLRSCFSRARVIYFLSLSASLVFHSTILLFLTAIYTAFFSTTKINPFLARVTPIYNKFRCNIM